jgi:hypothetical protein
MRSLHKGRGYGENDTVMANRRHHKIPRANYKAIKKSLDFISDELRKDVPKKKILPLARAMARQTDNIGPRRTRHRFIWEVISKHFVPV